MSTATTTLDQARRTRLSRLGILEEPLGYVDGQNLYQYVESNPLTRLDPDGQQTRPTTRPTTGPTTSPNEKVIREESFGGWNYPYLCNVPGAGSGLGNYGAMVERIAGRSGVEALAKALSLTADDLYQYGYSALAEIKKARVRRTTDSCERDVIYIDVREFVAVPPWKDLHDWEKRHIEKSPIAQNKYPKDKAAKMPNPAPGLQQWTRVREILNRVDGDVTKLTGQDTAEMLRLARSRRENAIRVILVETPWSKEDAPTAQPAN